ncbi:hypothetical protein SVIOM342S_03166 [Streptomyces violaceorubidus]
MPEKTDITRLSEQVIQAFGLTSNPRKELPPAVDDVSFEARAGRVTALLAASGAGKTTALRLMLELQTGPGGLTYFRGRPLHRIAHPREVAARRGRAGPPRPYGARPSPHAVRGGRRIRRPGGRGAGVARSPNLRDERLGTLSRGMDRRLGLACALVPDPHTLILDDPLGGVRPGRPDRCTAPCAPMPPRAARSCSARRTPRRPRAAPCTSSRWSGGRRRPGGGGVLPYPAAALASPYAARTPPASPRW